MRRINIVLVGAGKYNHTSQVVASIIKQADIFNFVGYCLPENEKEIYPEIIEQLKGYNELSLEEVLNHPEIEAVALQSEEIYCSKYLKLLSGYNKHIHMEKAGGINHNNFSEAVTTIKNNGKIFHMGYMYRYNPCIRNILEDIKAGEFGDIISVEAQMNCIHNDETRKWLKRLPGGMMYYLGCHLIDLVLKIQGEPLAVIPLNCRTGIGGVDSTDFGMAVLKYEKGTSFVKTSAAEIGGFARRQFVVVGTKKTVELKPLERYAENSHKLYTTATEYSSTEWHNPGITHNSPLFNRYDNMMKAFAAMVCGKTKNPNTYDYEIMLHKYILEACDGEC